MIPLPTLDEAQMRLADRCGMPIARIAAEVGIRPFGRGWHGRALERAAGLPDDNRPEPDGGTYEMKAVEIGPSGLPEGDVWIGRVPPGPLGPWRESRLLAKMERILFALWNDVPGRGPTLFGSAVGSLDDLPPSVHQQIERDWERLRQEPRSPKTRLLVLRTDGHGRREGRALCMRAPLAAAMMNRLSPDLLPLEISHMLMTPPKIRTMTIAEWIQVPTNPAQRHHAGRRAAHLDRLEPAHLTVSAAELPDGSLVKLDGHTRAYKWQKAPGLFPPHQILNVQVFPADGLQNAIDLYRRFDSKDAVETSADEIASALRLADLDPADARKIPLSTALNVVSGCRASRDHQADTVTSFRTEIQEVHRRAASLKAHKIKSGMLGAVILALRHHPKEVRLLLDALDDPTAPRIKSNGKRNILYALEERLDLPGRAMEPDEAAEHLLGILYVVHRDGIDAQRAFYPKADLTAYRADGRFVLKGTRGAKN
jgi:hypothetical protein